MKTFLFFSFAALLAGCGPAVHTPNQQPERQNKVLSANFSSIKKEILDVSCVRCHSRGSSNLDASRIPFESREDLLNSPRDLVVPKDPDSSGLVISIRPGAKKPMPPSGPPLSTDEITIIFQWIENGATE